MNRFRSYLTMKAFKNNFRNYFLVLCVRLITRLQNWGGGKTKTQHYCQT